MAARTFHVFPADGAWVVKKKGGDAAVFATQQEAVNAARISVKRATTGQLVVHGRDGRIREYETYRMTPIQDPPKKSRLASRIGRAVGRVALERVRSDSRPARASSPEK